MSHVLLSCALATALAVGFIDHRSGKMPNWMTLGSFGLGLIVRVVAAGTGGLTTALLGTLAAGGIPLGLFLATRGRAIGGGDVKALFALGVWLGPSLGFDVTLTSFVLLAVFALAQQALRGQMLPLLGRTASLVVPVSALRRFATCKDLLPPRANHLQMRFGPSLALGTLLVCASAIESSLA